ncbi:MAG: 1-acyl-sn-glycerol-3-phosphate acyltransferase [Caulobacteraceae bacterium]
MAYETIAAPLFGGARTRDHIVDRLIAERAPGLAGGAAWPVVRPVLYAILGYGRARRMADAIAPMSGRDALAFVSRLLSLRVTVQGKEHIPPVGRFVAVCNHPTGIADGVAVWDVVTSVRPDLLFYANADAHRVAPGLGQVLIPVEWVESRRTRARTRVTLARTRAAMEAERGLMIFPAGRLARRVAGGGAADLDWAPSAFSVARRYAAPVIPMHLAGPWPTLFHLFDGVSGELRDITLFHELLNKRGKRFHLIVGAPVMPRDLPVDPGEAAARMRYHVERDLPRRPDRGFTETGA